MIEEPSNDSTPEFIDDYAGMTEAEIEAERQYLKRMAERARRRGTTNVPGASLAEPASAEAQKPIVYLVDIIDDYAGMTEVEIEAERQYLKRMAERARRRR